MALYKHARHLTQSQHEAFDTLSPPATVANNPGIYRCSVCGDEVGIAKGQVLPALDHHQHAPGQGSIRWQLLVCAMQS